MKLFNVTMTVSVSFPYEIEVEAEAMELAEEIAYYKAMDMYDNGDFREELLFTNAEIIVDDVEELDDDEGEN